ncbi:MAG: hypothetical protein E7224_04415 [Clostridiales bacterium]|nr:hypothetical protein [Clostridiales bacterium]
MPYAKKSLIYVFVLLLLCTFPLSTAHASMAIPEDSVWDGTVASSFVSGTGSSDDPYVISNGQELALFSELVNTCAIDEDGMLFADKHYQLAANIILNSTFDFSNVPTNLNQWTPIASTYVPITIETEEDFIAAKDFYDGVYNEIGQKLWSIGDRHTVRSAFRGSFDGNGFSIIGMYISEEHETAGLFGSVLGATIKNIVIENAYVRNPRKDYGSLSGILAGEVNTNRKTPAYISNCFINNSYLEGERAGGIAGAIGGMTNYLPTVENCFVEITLKGLNINKGSGYVGGAFGNAACYARNCFVKGSVQGYNLVGGFTGWQEVIDTSFTNCLSLCTISIPAGANQKYSVGGFIGKNEFDVKLTNCFWLAQENALATSFKESDLYGYAIDKSGQLITASEKFSDPNILNILNEWALENCSTPKALWTVSAGEIEISNIAIEENQENTNYILLHTLNQLFSPTYVAIYDVFGRMTTLSEFESNTAKIIKGPTESTCILYSLTPNYTPICKPYILHHGNT